LFFLALDFLPAQTFGLNPVVGPHGFVNAGEDIQDRALTGPGLDHRSQWFGLGKNRGRVAFVANLGNAR